MFVYTFQLCSTILLDGEMGRYVISFLKEHGKEIYTEVRAAYIDTMNKVNALELIICLYLFCLCFSILFSSLFGGMLYLFIERMLQWRVADLFLSLCA